MMQRQAWPLALATGAILASVPGLAFAEVIDKEPAASAFWVWAVCAGVLGLVAWASLPRVIAAVVGGVTLAAGGIYLLGMLADIFDPSVGPAIAAEAGRGYLIQYWAALALFLALEAVGIFAWRWRSPNKRVNLTRSGWSQQAGQ
jgi:hypothetical protein